MAKEGVTMPSVAATAPGTPAILVPTKVEALMAMGPGVISAMARRSIISSSESQPFLETKVCSSTGIMA